MSESLPNTALTVLHFLLQNIRVCVELNYIQRILPLPLLETVPGSPPYLAGLMNLAGTSIPVIDLGLRIGLQRINSYSLDMPILLCLDGSQRTGMIVDDVLGLVKVDTSDVQMRTDFVQHDSPFLGVLPVNAELSLFLNIKRVITISLTAKKSNLTIDNNLLNKAKKRHE